VGVTRRGVGGSLLAGLSLSACARLLIDPTLELGPRGWREVRVRYGPDPHQNLFVVRPVSGARSVVLILSDARPTTADEALARHVADQGMVAVLVGRRPAPVAHFPAYGSDAARAVAWSYEHLSFLGLVPSAPIGLLAIGEGGHSARMLVHDPRYLALVRMEGRLKAVAVAAPDRPVDGTFTHPSLYVPKASAPRFSQFEPSQLEAAINSLKQELNQACHSSEL
jgi:hypothetical protein